MAIRRRREPEITDYTDYSQPVQQPTRPRASSSADSETLTYGKIVPQGRRGMREPRSLLEAMWYANPTSTTSQVVRPTNVLEPVGTSAARRAEANARVGMDADPVFDIYNPRRSGLAAATGAAAGGLGMVTGGGTRTQVAQAGGTMSDAAPASTSSVSAPTTRLGMVGAPLMSNADPTAYQNFTAPRTSQSPLDKPFGMPSTEGMSFPSRSAQLNYEMLTPAQLRKNMGDSPYASDPAFYDMVRRGAARGEYNWIGAAVPIPDFNDNSTNRSLGGGFSQVVPGPGRPGTMSAEYDRYMGYDKTLSRNPAPAPAPAQSPGLPAPEREGARDFNRYFGGMP